MDGGHKAIVYSRLTGIKNTVYGEGLKFKIPWVEREIIYNARAVGKRVKTQTGSKGKKKLKRKIKKQCSDKLKYFHI